MRFEWCLDGHSWLVASVLLSIISITPLFVIATVMERCDASSWPSTRPDSSLDKSSIITILLLVHHYHAPSKPTQWLHPVAASIGQSTVAYASYIGRVHRLVHPYTFRRLRELHVLHDTPRIDQAVTRPWLMLRLERYLNTPRSWMLLYAGCYEKSDCSCKAIGHGVESTSTTPW